MILILHGRVGRCYDWIGGNQFGREGGETSRSERVASQPAPAGANQDEELKTYPKKSPRREEMEAAGHRGEAERGRFQSCGRRRRRPRWRGGKS